MANNEKAMIIVTCIFIAIVVFVIILDLVKSHRINRKTRAFAGYKLLGAAEQRLLRQLVAIRYTELWVCSLWQHAIESAIETGSVSKFRLLLRELQCAGRDNPTLMISIIGVDAWDALRTYVAHKPARVVPIESNDSAVHGEWEPAAQF
jgi:hypothetical protein